MNSAALDRDHAHHIDIMGGPAALTTRNQVVEVAHLEAATTLATDSLELIVDPATSRADPPGPGECVAQGVAGAEPDQCGDVRPDSFRIGASCDAVEAGGSGRGNRLTVEGQGAPLGRTSGRGRMRICRIGW